VIALRFSYNHCIHRNFSERGELMSSATTTTDITTVPQPVTLDFRPVLRKINDDDFFEFCRANRDLRIERTKEGELILMPPTGGETGRRNFDLNVIFGIWARTEGTGLGFDSSSAGGSGPSFRRTSIERLRVGDERNLGIVG
jgi:Putative restriction endonuclease